MLAYACPRVWGAVWDSDHDCLHGQGFMLFYPLKPFYCVPSHRVSDGFSLGLVPMCVLLFLGSVDLA